MSITEFLLARIAEGEEEAAWYGNMEGFEGGWAKEHTARVLRECAAKRAVITSQQSCAAVTAKEQVPGIRLVSAGMVQGLDLALQYLAAVYADHQDYQQEWKP